MSAKLPDAIVRPISRHARGIRRTDNARDASYSRPFDPRILPAMRNTILRRAIAMTRNRCVRRVLRRTLINVMIVTCGGCRSNAERADVQTAQSTDRRQDESAAVALSAAAAAGTADLGAQAAQNPPRLRDGSSSRPATAISTASEARPNPLTPLDNFHVVADGRAYRSGQLRPQSLRYVIERYGIKTIVNLRGENPDKDWYVREKQACAAAGVEMIDIGISSRELPPRERLLALYDVFTSREEPILMHCSGGADRSGAAAAIWRMTALGEDRKLAARQLSFIYGHIGKDHAAMDRLVEMFKPDRTWIERDYAGSPSAADADDDAVFPPTSRPTSVPASQPD